MVDTDLVFVKNERDVEPVDDVPQVTLIAVMGVTGSGKSNFIRLATGSSAPIISDGLSSCTQTTTQYECFLGGRQFVFLDTPGFDDTYRGDADVLAEIAENLRASYKNRLKISGIIYLHRIKDERMTNAIMRNLSMFHNLCGDDAFRNVTLVTTFWDEMRDFAKGERREKELKETKQWWGYMASKGSRVRRFMNTRDSALDIIAELSGLQRVALQIQTEMVDKGLDIDKTTAGVALNSEIAALVEKHKEDMKTLQVQLEQAMSNHDIELQATIEEMQNEKKELIENLQNEQELLRADRREEIRRMEQQFNDQLLRMQRERQTSEKEMELLETRLYRERTDSERRIQEAMATADRYIQQAKGEMEQARGDERRRYEEAVRAMEERQRESKQEREKWERELANSNEQIRQLSLAQIGAGVAERRGLEARIERLEAEKQQSATNFWDFISPITGIALAILGGQYM